MNKPTRIRYKRMSDGTFDVQTVQQFLLPNGSLCVGSFDPVTGQAALLTLDGAVISSSPVKGFGHAKVWVKTALKESGVTFYEEVRKKKGL